jgi:hypothetical protein
VDTGIAFEARASRARLSLLTSLGGVTISTLLASLLLGRLAFGPEAGARGETAEVARLGISGIMILGSILPPLLIMRFVPQRNSRVVNYTYQVLRWVSSLTFAILFCLTLPAIFSGDAESLFFAAIAVALFPMEIGSYRRLTCVFLAILAFGLVVARPSSEAFLDAVSCILAAWVCAAWLALKKEGKAWSTKKSAPSI